jgi:2-polyprenyl-3-methyl-5-hydroxy-6-metoxy-1,4-benzoquinol methylase
MPDFSKRSKEIEIMDDLSAGGEVINVTLRELETINRLLGGNHVTINGLKKLLKHKHPTKKIVLADLGCGSGDILKLIRKYFRKRGFSASLVGVDANENITAYAKQHTPPTEDISYQAINIFSDAFRAQKFDVVTGTLFFHHFTDQELIQFFSNLKNQVAIGIVINDIHRHWFAYYSIKWLTFAFSRSVMVRNDAAVSVMRAFSKSELNEILVKAGFKNFTICWMWAFRWQVVIHQQ